MEGKTSTGFGYNIDKNAIADDWELVELLVNADGGDNAATVKAMKVVLGGEYDRLKEHIRSDSGKVSAVRMRNEFLEILSQLGEDAKN